MHPRETTAAALGLGLVLAVVIAAAGIRLESGIPGLRLVHRVAASLEVLVVAWLAWMDWRRPAVRIALALTVVLSLVGILAGQNPPPAAAAVNLLGGLSLAATFAWILGKRGQDPFARSAKAFARRARERFLTPFLLIAAQLALGAWLSIGERYSMALPLHGLLAVGLTAFLVWLGRGRPVLLALSLAAPAAGFTALHYEWSAAAALGHAIAVALLVAAVAHAAALDSYQGNARPARQSAGHE